MSTFPTFGLPGVVFVLQTHDRMSIIVGIWVFMSMIYFMLGWVEHERGL